MYYPYTRQSMPNEEYLKILSMALYAFNSNNAFIIENILHTAPEEYSWHTLMDKESGKLESLVKKVITENSTPAIANLFHDLVHKRNRIIHSFPITEDITGEQILQTKDKFMNNNQYPITIQYLKDFLKDNEKLSDLLNKYRDKITKTK